MHVWFCFIDLDLFAKEEVCFEVTKPGRLLLYFKETTISFSNIYEVKFGEVIWSDQKTTFTNTLNVLHNNCLVEEKGGGYHKCTSNLHQLFYLSKTLM